MAKSKAPAPSVEAAPGSPAAALAARPGLRVRPQRPVRAFVGGLVVIAAVVAALALYTRIGDRSEVLMLTRTVLAGEQITDGDLRVVSIGSDESFAAMSADLRGEVVGQFAKVRLESGSLLVADQLQATRLVSEDRVLASVTIPIGEVPVGLREQSRVALIVIPGAEIAEETGSGPLAVEATVTALPRNLAEIVGNAETTTRTVVPLSVEIPPESATLVGSAESVSVVVIDPSDPFPEALEEAGVSPVPASEPAANTPTPTAAANNGDDADDADEGDGG